MQSRELALNDIQPGGIGWQVDRFHIMAWEEIVRGAPVGREVVHDEIDPDLDRITGAELSKTGNDIARGFAFANATDQAVGMDIVEGM